MGFFLILRFALTQVLQHVHNLNCLRYLHVTYDPIYVRIQCAYEPIYHLCNCVHVMCLIYVHVGVLCMRLGVG